MLCRFLADLVVFLHFLFILFVLTGGIGAYWYRPIVWVHIPSVVWGIVVELTGWICPLTPFENFLRIKGGLHEYRSDFIEHYIIPIVYPDFMTRKHQVFMGLGVLILNACVYWKIWKQAPKRSPELHK